MNMFWNRKLSSEWGSGAVVHMLRAATIAAVVSSCSTSPPRSPAVLAEAEAPQPPPLVMLLAPASPLAGDIKAYAWNTYRNLPTVERSAYEHLLREENQLQSVYITISYMDPENTEKERLLALAPTLPNPNNTDWDANPASARIPIPPGPGSFSTDWDDANIYNTGSPLTATYCQPVGSGSSAGTRYCWN
jgi:hypothetical protein